MVEGLELCGSPCVAEDPRRELARFPAGTHSHPIDQFPDVHKHRLLTRGEGRKEEPPAPLKTLAEHVRPKYLSELTAEGYDAPGCAGLEPAVRVGRYVTMLRSKLTSSNSRPRTLAQGGLGALAAHSQ
jgi:hypothetical protein